MKFNVKIIFLIIFFFTVSFIAAAPRANKSILDYYNTIPERLLNNYRYPLEHKKGKWMARSDNGFEFEAIVDIKNGYISITDLGSGGGTTGQQVALFRTNAGSVTIGVSLTELDYDSFCTINFYKPTDNQWTDVTGNLLPEIDLFMFMDGSFPVEKHRMDWFKQFTKGIVLMYQLPRRGTTINVKIDLEQYIQDHRRDLERFIIERRSGDKNTTSHACEILKSVKYREIKLIWDKKSNKFNIGNKTLFVPYSDLEKRYMNVPH